MPTDKAAKVVYYTADDAAFMLLISSVKYYSSTSISKNYGNTTLSALSLNSLLNSKVNFEYFYTHFSG